MSSSGSTAPLVSRPASAKADADGAPPDTEADDASVVHAAGRIERDRGGDTAQSEVTPSDRHLLKARSGPGRPPRQLDLRQQLTCPECGAKSRDEELLRADCALTPGAPQREPGFERHHHGRQLGGR